MYAKPDEWHYSCGRGHRRLLCFMEYVVHWTQKTKCILDYEYWYLVYHYGPQTTIHHSIRATLAFWGREIKCFFHANAANDKEHECYRNSIKFRLFEIRKTDPTFLYLGLVYERKSDFNPMNIIQLDHWNINFQYIYSFYSPERAFVRP